MSVCAASGIEWDDFGRGLHDGSVVLPDGQVQRYFDGPPGRQTSASAALEFKCSFLKTSKLLTDGRQTLLQRLHERYGHSRDDGADEAGDAMSVEGEDSVVAGGVGTTLGSQKPIELVGVAKLQTQQTFATITSISLSDCGIASLGAQRPGELRELMPSVTELNLSNNLFRSWSDVFEVLAEFPALETLVLSGNRLVYDGSSASFSQIKVLVLNQTFPVWSVLLQVLERHFPQLAELHIAGNELSDEELALLTQAETRPSWWESLELIDLSNNRLKNWAVVERSIGNAFVHLKQLLVVKNQITTLVSSTSVGLQQLKSLSVNDNRIDSWSSIDTLRQYPHLDSLRLVRNPLVAQMSESEARMIVIARTESLAVFNASVIRNKERLDAEQLYLKRILHEMAAVKQTPEEQARVLAFHPRFQRLRELYPEIYLQHQAGQGGGITSGPTTLASSLIRVKIVPMSMQATTFDPLVKKIPERMKVSQLKVLIANKFGVEVQDQLLSFRVDTKVRAFCCSSTKRSTDSQLQSRACR